MLTNVILLMMEKLKNLMIKKFDALSTKPQPIV